MNIKGLRPHGRKPFLFFANAVAVFHSKSLFITGVPLYEFERETKYSKGLKYALGMLSKWSVKMPCIVFCQPLISSG